MRIGLQILKNKIFRSNKINLHRNNLNPFLSDQGRRFTNYAPNTILDYEFKKNNSLVCNLLGPQQQQRQPQVMHLVADRQHTRRLMGPDEEFQAVPW